MYLVGKEYLLCVGLSNAMLCSSKQRSADYYSFLLSWVILSLCHTFELLARQSDPALEIGHCQSEFLLNGESATQFWLHSTPTITIASTHSRRCIIETCIILDEAAQRRQFGTAFYIGVLWAKFTEKQFIVHSDRLPMSAFLICTTDEYKHASIIDKDNSLDQKKWIELNHQVSWSSAETNNTAAADENELSQRNEDVKQHISIVVWNGDFGCATCFIWKRIAKQFF